VDALSQRTPALWVEDGLCVKAAAPEPPTSGAAAYPLFGLFFNHPASVSSQSATPMLI
jgi:hypothetical protein